MKCSMAVSLKVMIGGEGFKSGEGNWDLLMMGIVYHFVRF